MAQSVRPAHTQSRSCTGVLSRRFADEGLSILFTRSFTHVGAGQEPSYAASSFAYQIARVEAGEAKPVINVGSLDTRRDLTDVRDTVRAYQALMARGRAVSRTMSAPDTRTASATFSTVCWP